MFSSTKKELNVSYVKNIFSFNVNNKKSSNSLPTNKHYVNRGVLIEDELPYVLPGSLLSKQQLRF